MGIYVHFENTTGKDGEQYLETNIYDENLKPLVSDNPDEKKKEELNNKYNQTPIAMAMAALDIGMKFLQDMAQAEEESGGEADPNIGAAQAQGKGTPFH